MPPVGYDWSSFYDAAWVQRLTYRPVQDAVLEALHPPACARILDVGCGTGLFSRRIARVQPDARVIGLDFSAGMLRHASARASSVAWVRGNALHLPFPDAAFDAIVSTESFHWFPDQGLALAEFHRVLAPGGRLLVALVHMPLETMTQAARLGTGLVGEPARWPTRARMRSAVEHAGFRVEAQTRIFRIPLGLTLPPVLTVAVAAGRSRSERSGPGVQGSEGFA